MTVLIKPVENEDMLRYMDLNIRMFKTIDDTINPFGAINHVVHEITTKEDYKAIGMYDDDELVGFLSGYCFSTKKFHFSGIYVIMKNNKNLSELIDFTLELIKNEGYSAWSVDTTNSNITSIVEKYGATAKSTRFVKEF